MASSAEHESSGRATRQGEAIRRVMQDIDAARTAQELHSELADRGESVGLATVYRHLQHLVDDGVLEVSQTDDGQVSYRYCGVIAHHHHLVCRRCGTSVEIRGPEVETWAARVSSENGFVDVDHNVELYGLCPKCAKEKPKTVDSK